LAAIWATAAVELSVVPLLIWKRTRWVGILVGSVFHGVISLDLDQHFYDFTAVLCFLFAGFLVTDQDQERELLGGPVVKWVAVPVSLLLVVLATIPPTATTSQILRVFPFILWVPFLFWWVGVVLGHRVTVSIARRIPAPVVAVAALAVINGLTPYFELKTGYSFNMYSNLVTAQGESNHFVVQRTLPLRDGYRGPVDIIESSDPGLEAYRDRGYLIAYPQFQQYLMGKNLSVTYERLGTTSTIADTSQIQGLATSGPWWWRYMPLRALDKNSPARCQDVFLPAL
jgi:hypothetical protein